MNGQTFDRLTKVAGVQQSRRRALRSLAAAGLALAAAATGLDSVAAAVKRSAGNSCNVGADCLSGRCDAVTRTRSICASGCANALLWGSANGNGVYVDDELVVYVNGVKVFEYRGPATTFSPIPLGALKSGDSIRVVANNSPYYCGYMELSPLYLACAGGGVTQVLDPTGYPGNWGACGEVFYDRTFTVAY